MKAEDWIKVTDRLPEFNTEVLVAQFTLNCGWWYEVASVCKNDFNKLRWYNQDGWDLDYVTHWMPIVPPKED